MTGFDAKAAADYDERIVRLVPGYRVAQDLSAAILGAKLPDAATVLVAGCGTGAELVRLASANRTWRFVAVDPSEAMIARARDKMRAIGGDGRVTFVAARIEDAPAAEHDAVVALLVGHFIPDDGARLRFLCALASRVRKDGPLAIFDYESAPAGEPAYRRWLTDGGHDPAAADAVIARIEANWFPVSERRRNELLKQAGFADCETVFRALGYRATTACRR